MKSRDLTAEQLERLQREVDRQVRYYVNAWRRIQANDIPVDDPLAVGVCEAWKGIAHLANVLEDLQRRLPRAYRPLADPHKTSGLASVELPWAEKQRRAAEELEKQRARPVPPNTS